MMNRVFASVRKVVFLSCLCVLALLAVAQSPSAVATEASPSTAETKADFVPLREIPKDYNFLERKKMVADPKFKKCPAGFQEVCDIYQRCDARGCFKSTICACMPI